MVSELKIFLLEGMEAISTTRVKKFEYDQVVFYQVLYIFEEYKIPTEEREKLLWFLKEWHE